MDGLSKHQNYQRPFADGTPSNVHVERTLKRLIEANIQPRIRVTVTSRNVSTLPDIIRYLASLKCQKVQFEPVAKCGRASVNKTMKRPAKEKYVKYFLEASKVAIENNITIYDVYLMRLFKPSLLFCDGIGGRNHVVNPDGSISICVGANSRQHPAAKYFIRKFRKAKTLIEKTAMTNIARKCKICFCKYLCSGGCPLINLNTTGNVYKPDPYRCYITKKLVTHFLTNG
jgi:radical SAM protein with 4Fe4S-binding SPASM domain